MAQLDAMKVFAAVASAGGFRPAAQRMGLSSSTVSDLVRRLEDDLGVRLFHRNTRGVSPTDAGRTLLAGVKPAFELIDRTVEGLRGLPNQPTGRLRLTAPEIVTRYILPDLLVRFLSTYPGIEVDLATTNAVVDIVDAGFDAAIRYEERVARDMIAVPIGPPTQRYVAAASPAYLKRHGTPTEPTQLSGHRLIGHRLPSGAVVTWEFARGGRLKQVTPAGTLTTPSIDLRVAAATAGVGLIYTFEEVLRPSIHRGDLIVVMEDWSVSFAGPVLCYHSDRHIPTPLEAFLAFLR